MRAVTTWYLEMRDPSALRPAPPPRRPLDLRRAEVPSPEFSRFLYTAVGGDWYWTDRDGWTYAEWQRWLGQPEVSIWVAYDAGNPAGFAELQAQPLAGDDRQRQLEICAFGLLPQFRGIGAGGWLLTEVLRRALATGAHRIWLHTCTLDGPAAPPNYRARGMAVYDHQTEHKQLPARPAGPWPGARE